MEYAFISRKVVENIYIVYDLYQGGYREYVAYTFMSREYLYEVYAFISREYIYKIYAFLSREYLYMYLFQGIFF